MPNPSSRPSLCHMHAASASNQSLNKTSPWQCLWIMYAAMSAACTRGSLSESTKPTSFRANVGRPRYRPGCTDISRNRLLIFASVPRLLASAIILPCSPLPCFSRYWSKRSVVNIHKSLSRSCRLEGRRFFHIMALTSTAPDSPIASTVLVNSAVFFSWFEMRKSAENRPLLLHISYPCSSHFAVSFPLKSSRLALSMVALALYTSSSRTISPLCM